MKNYIIPLQIVDDHQYDHVSISCVGFDAATGPTYQVTYYNVEGDVLNRKHLELGDAWTNWPATVPTDPGIPSGGVVVPTGVDTPVDGEPIPLDPNEMTEDDLYVTENVLTALNLTKRQ